MVLAGVRDAEVGRHALGIAETTAADGHKFRPFADAECRRLGAARESRPDEPDSDLVIFHHLLVTLRISPLDRPLEPRDSRSTF